MHTTRKNREGGLAQTGWRKKKIKNRFFPVAKVSSGAKEFQKRSCKKRRNEPSRERRTLREGTLSTKKGRRGLSGDDQKGAKRC